MIPDISRSKKAISIIETITSARSSLDDFRNLSEVPPVALQTMTLRVRSWHTILSDFQESDGVWFFENYPEESSALTATIAALGTIASDFETRAGEIRRTMRTANEDFRSGLRAAHPTLESIIQNRESIPKFVPPKITVDAEAVKAVVSSAVDE